MYKCKNCWYTSAVKLWKCPECWSFWSFEEDQTIISNKTKSKKKQITKWQTLTFEKEKIKTEYFPIQEAEFQRIFSKWIKKWWIYLLAWEPGIWKSTIILQIINQLPKNLKIWYFSGEENVEQILERAMRISDENKQKIPYDSNFWPQHTSSDFKIYHSTILEDILTTIEVENFDFVVFDSIQTIYSNQIDSPAGSVSQVKFVSEKISEFSKKNNITSFIIGHITKWWEIAWPKYLEHIVDVVLYLEWDRFGQYRFLRAKKNRFWPSDEVWIFEMTLFGLQPVYDIKQRILQSAKTSIPGNVLTVWIDNARPVLVNLEVLLNKTNYKYPKRTAIWVDSSRLDLVIAILERYLKFKLWYFDIFVNIPWEWKFYDAGLDLAIAAAILWQYKNKLIDKNKVFIGEIWLGWQILPSKLHTKRIKEIPEWFEIIDHNKIKNIVELENIV